MITPALSQGYTHSLQSLMQRVGISSFKTLARSSGVSERQLMRLRRGEVKQMRLDVLLKLSQALQVTLTELLSTFSELDLSEKHSSPTDSREKLPQPNNIPPHESNQADVANYANAALRQEYQRLQAQLEQQRQAVWQEFQQSSLDILESWLRQWPRAAYKAQENPQLPAVGLLNLMKPIEKLLQQWGVEAIAPVGVELPYDPKLHQLWEGTAQQGERVKVRHTGYRHGDKLLHRAMVIPIPQA